MDGEYQGEEVGASPASVEEVEYTSEEGGASQASEETEESEDGQVPFNEHPRWKAVHGELKTYKELGATPEQIRQLGREVQFYRDLDARQKQQQQNKPQSEEDKSEGESIKAARAALMKVAPELGDVGPLKQILTMLGQQAQQHREGVDEMAHSALSALMAQSGLPTDEKKVTDMARRMIPIIQNDEALLQLYFRDPNKAVQKAWDDFTKDIDIIASRRTNARLAQKGLSLSLLPRAQQGAGGFTPKAGAKPAQTIDELFKRERGTLSGKG